ncbi:class I SAM-dependent methyltransferase [bacterium]|nr:class I SAM-dependent methyltransferase [bacterium]
MEKAELPTMCRNGLVYMVDDRGRPRTCKPWLGDAFSFLYDRIMAGSVFPKKFGSDPAKHYHILGNELRTVHGKRVLELATGSGSAVHFLPPDNRYTGSDISRGLLRQAVKRFSGAGFQEVDLYVASAEDLPFADNSFDVVLCILSLNFFSDIPGVLKDMHRLAAEGGVCICCVPVPERNSRNSTIHGTLYSEKELRAFVEEAGFRFETIPEENGALLYFRAVKS